MRKPYIEKLSQMGLTIGIIYSFLLLLGTVISLAYHTYTLAYLLAAALGLTSAIAYISFIDLQKKAL